MQKLIIYKDDECSMKRACKALEGKWKIPVIYVLCVANGTLRYSQLRQALGITNVMLSNTLKDLEEEGLIERNAYNEIPPRVDYSLSELSRELVRPSFFLPLGTEADGMRSGFRGRVRSSLKPAQPFLFVQLACIPKGSNTLDVSNGRLFFMER